MFVPMLFRNYYAIMATYSLGLNGPIMLELIPPMPTYTVTKWNNI